VLPFADTLADPSAGATDSSHREGALFDRPRQAGTRDLGLFSAFRMWLLSPGVATLATH
jgi:hypothetical protein